MSSSSEESSCLRRIDSCITQHQAREYQRRRREEYLGGRRGAFRGRPLSVLPHLSALSSALPSPTEVTLLSTRYDREYQNLALALRQKSLEGCRVYVFKTRPSTRVVPRISALSSVPPSPADFTLLSTRVTCRGHATQHKIGQRMP